MEYLNDSPCNSRSSGATGLSVSRLCIGTGTFGKQTDEGEAFRILDTAADAGVNFIDTADIYPGVLELDDVGRAEEITGKWLKGKRGRHTIGTKAGWPMGTSPWDQGCSRKHLLAAIDESLRRLNTDYVDLYHATTYIVASIGPSAVSAIVARRS